VRRRLAVGAAALSFVVLLVLLVWQGSFRIEYTPSGVGETVVVWAVSTFIFLLTITLAFMLFRAVVKAYIDRQRNKEGSRIRSKLLAGALVLTLAPAFFYVVFSFYVLNRHLDAWFGRPARDVQAELKELDAAYKREAQERVQAQADWLALLPQTVEAAQTGQVEAQSFRSVCERHAIRQAVLTRTGQVPILLHQAFGPSTLPLFRASAPVLAGGSPVGEISILAPLSTDPLAKAPAAAEEKIRRSLEADSGRTRLYQDAYLRLILLITVFVFFVAAWAAQILSRQISIPISALLGAAEEVRRGNLSYRVRVHAIDELATLVRAFNEMTRDLEGNARELEARRQFTEAILESIPTGVISVTPDERIEHVNRALRGIFPNSVVESSNRLKDLFSAEDLAEIRYLVKRSRRIGAAASQLELQQGTAVMHLAVTVASLEQRRGFVIVLEDTSDLLRAQKALAWQEVARRIAHEIKNPLTPISLSADRIARQLSRLPLEPATRAILEECTGTIQQEVMSVKTLVDEFSQFSRFPAAKPVPSNLNEIVENALSVFAGRLESIELSVVLDPRLTTVIADREQIKRVIVNLVDNAAEAMLNSPVRKLRVQTSQVTPELVELSVTDTGPGISPADKEKLFLPYFSTKARGTGLGLAIVSRIIKEHHGRVRVEDNQPAGASFVIELNAAGATDATGTESVDATLKA
jgi:nitrogen fixation/metabolism regulation signal transduction histidine kinase